MPLFTFECKKCNKKFEVLLKTSDVKNPKCMECKSNKNVIRYVGNSSFILKGTGWYRDGYSSKPPDTSTQPKSEVHNGTVRIPIMKDNKE
jgi:putative FmdB family regulatory protein